MAGLAPGPEHDELVAAGLTVGMTLLASGLGAVIASLLGAFASIAVFLVPMLVGTATYRAVIVRLRNVDAEIRARREDVYGT